MLVTLVALRYDGNLLKVSADGLYDKQAVLRRFCMQIGHLLQQRGGPGETLIESAGCRSFRLHSHFKTNLICIACKDSQKRE